MSDTFTRNGEGSLPRLKESRQPESDVAADAAANPPPDFGPFDILTVRQLIDESNNLRYLVDRILVAGQPLVIGGPKKGMKTTLALDLALSLASGKDFLDRFAVNERCRVLVFSSESGAPTLGETVARIARHKGADIDQLETENRIGISKYVPKVTNKVNLRQFENRLKDFRPDVVVLDPQYKILSGDEASNVYKQGAELDIIADICLGAGATPIVCHHLKSKRLYQFGPADLDDLTQSGAAEFYRGWILVNRSERYKVGSGVHRLWMTAGNCSDEGSAWKIIIDERRNDSERTYQPFTEHAAHAVDKPESKEDQTENLDKIREALADEPEGLTVNGVCEVAKVHHRLADFLLKQLVETGEVRQVGGGVSKGWKRYKLSVL